MKKYIIGFIVGVIVATTIAVSATILYQANEIGFTPEDNNWNVNNLDSALNDLYDIAGSVLGNGTFIASDLDCEGKNIGYTYTSEITGKLFVTLYASKGANGSRTMSCKKNDVEVEYDDFKTRDNFRDMKIYLIDVVEGDVITVSANSTGNYGDVGYSIFLLS